MGHTASNSDHRDSSARASVLPSRRRDALIIAHRGASGDFPENTLPAFAAAIAAGAAMCELDVHRTADGALVVIHDDTLGRTTNGHGKVAAISFADLRRLDAGRCPGPTFERTRVPTLQEVLELVRGKCALNIELKGNGIAAAVCALVAHQHAAESTLISSFDWPAIAAVRRIAPTIPTALLTDRAALRALETGAQMGAAALNPRHDLVDRRLCAAAQERGLRLYAWTVDDRGEMGRLIDAGVDGIMTNYPARLRALMQG